GFDGRRLGDKVLLRYLADHGLRQVFAEFDLPWHLERRELVPQKIAQLRRRHRGALTQLDEGLDDFAAMRVGNTAYGDLLDGGMEVYDLLHLSRIDVEAAAEDQVLDPVDDIEIAILVQMADVPGVQADA